MTPEESVERQPDENLVMLRSLLGQRVVRFTRLSWGPLADVAHDKWSPVPDELVFCRAAGALIVALESGLSVGFGSQPSLASVTMWPVTTPEGWKRDSFSFDDEKYPVEAQDPRY